MIMTVMDIILSCTATVAVILLLYIVHCTTAGNCTSWTYHAFIWTYHALSQTQQIYILAETQEFGRKDNYSIIFTVDTFNSLINTLIVDR